jgi:hypothetical protein
MDNLFYFKDRDGHYIIKILGLRLSFRHKCNFKYKPAIEYGINTEKSPPPQLIVSLTSFPKRINYVVYTINTLLQQTLKPDRIFLWLADSQFPNKEQDLPTELLNLRKLGLEIKWCEDIKSLKKLLPALKEFPNDIIVTADDDLYYDENWLKELYDAYEKNPNYVYVHRVSKLKFDNDKVMQCKRRELVEKCHTKPSLLNSIYGGSGCLYPPKFINMEVFNVENAIKIADNADDLWFWAMLALNNKKVIEVRGDKSDFKIIEGSDSCALCKINRHRDFNMIYKNLTDTYPKILENIKSELATNIGDK